MMLKIFSTAALLQISSATLAISSANLSCDLDANVTLTFNTSGGQVINKASVGTDAANCSWAVVYDGSQGFFTRSESGGTYSYSLEVPSTCMSDTETTAKTGGLKLYFSASPTLDLFLGNTTQDITCNLARSARVNYDFNTITLASEAADAESFGTGTFSLTRQTDDNYNTENSSNAVTSGEMLYFLVKSTDSDLPAGVTYELEKCEISKTGMAEKYVLFDLYNAEYCIEDFLSTTVSQNNLTDHQDKGSWRFAYTAFTMGTGNEVADAITLGCDILLCNKQTDTDGNGHCLKNSLVLPEPCTAELTALEDPPSIARPICSNTSAPLPAANPGCIQVYVQGSFQFQDLFYMRREVTPVISRYGQLTGWDTEKDDDSIFEICRTNLSFDGEPRYTVKMGCEDRYLRMVWFYEGSTDFNAYGDGGLKSPRKRLLSTENPLNADGTLKIDYMFMFPEHSEDTWFGSFQLFLPPTTYTDPFVYDFGSFAGDEIGSYDNYKYHLNEDSGSTITDYYDKMEILDQDWETSKLADPGWGNGNWKIKFLPVDRDQVMTHQEFLDAF